MIGRSPHPVDRDEQAASWCIALAARDLAESDRAAFDEWLAHPDNAEAFANATRTWKLSDMASGMPEIVGLRTAALQSYRRANQGRWRGDGGNRRWLAAVAALLILVIGTAFWLRDPVERYRTGIGERRIAMLEDGSRLTLDSDTQVDVRWERDRRALTLVRGRAKFDVAKNPLRPFTVAAGDKLVVATGTSFSVETLSHDMRVLLYEGHVAVLDGAQASVTAGAPPALDDRQLAPGRELVAAIGGHSPARISTVNPQRSLSWERGQISFDDEPLETAIERMNRYSRTQFELEPGSAADVRVNGVFNAGDTASFVEGVTSVSSLAAERQGDRIAFVLR